MTNLPDYTVRIDEVFDAVVDARLRQIRVGMPGIVQSYNSSEQSCDVQPALTEPDGTQYPVITRVPVVFPQGAGFAITWPLSEGDSVWLSFAERDIERWLNQGGNQSSNSPRVFDMSDAVAFPGMSPYSAPLSDAGVDHMVISIPGGKELRLGQGATDFVALAADVLTELQSIKTDFDLHTHSGVTTGPGVSGVPSVPLTAPSSVAATKVKAE